MLRLIMFAVAVLASAPALAGAKAICLARGNNVGGNDAGVFVSDSRLQVRIYKDADLLELSADGVIMVTSAYEELQSPEDLNPSNAYIGLFNTKAIPENPDYRPRRYKGYAQFKDFDAEATAGHESGMWGYFLIDRKAALGEDKSFHGVYIFQAGDHMGGTLHFTCTKP